MQSESAGLSLARVTATLGMLLALAACATSPISDSEAREVPLDRLLTRQWQTPGNSTGQLTVKRDRGYIGSACNVVVYIDGIALASLAPREKVLANLPAGQHVLSARAGDHCGGGIAESAAIVEAGIATTFRVSYGGGGNLAIQPTAF